MEPKALQILKISCIASLPASAAWLLLTDNMHLWRIGKISITILDIVILSILINFLVLIYEIIRALLIRFANRGL